MFKALPPCMQNLTLEGTRQLMAVDLNGFRYPHALINLGAMSQIFKVAFNMIKVICWQFFKPPNPIQV